MDLTTAVQNTHSSSASDGVSEKDLDEKDVSLTLSNNVVDERAVRPKAALPIYWRILILILTCLCSCMYYFLRLHILLTY